MRITGSNKSPVLDPIHSLQSCVLEILALNPGTDIESLHKRIEAEYGYVASIQNLYKLVAKLIQAQLLIRDGGLLSLNLVWVVQISQYADQIKNTYMNASAIDSDVRLKPGESREYYAPSLLGLDSIWSHAMIQLTKIEKEKIWYEYDYHPWHLLALGETETRFREGLASQGIRLKTIWGRDSYLDRYAKKLAEMKGYDVMIVDQPLTIPKNQSLFVCGSHVVTCSLPLQIFNHLEVFFENIKSLENFDAKFFTDVFKLHARCKLTVKRDQSEANKLRTQLQALV